MERCVIQSEWPPPDAKVIRGDDVFEYCMVRYNELRNLFRTLLHQDPEPVHPFDQVSFVDDLSLSFPRRVDVDLSDETIAERREQDAKAERCIGDAARKFFGQLNRTTHPYKCQIFKDAKQVRRTKLFLN